MGCILAAIENALHAAEQEQSGLNGRIEGIPVRAAVTLGNGAAEYLERDARDSHHQGPVFSRDFKRSSSPQGTGRSRISSF